MTKYVCTHTQSLNLEKDAHWEFGADGHRLHLASNFLGLACEVLMNSNGLPSDRASAL